MFEMTNAKKGTNACSLLASEFEPAKLIIEVEETIYSNIQL